MAEWNTRANAGQAAPIRPLRVRSLKLGDMDNLVYLIEDPASRRVAVLDPAWDADAVLEEAGDEVITDILVSHWHDDHVNAIADLLAATDASVHMLQREVEYWDAAPRRLVRHRDGDRIHLGELDIQIVHSPGHSPGSACFYVEDALFSGDTLFVYGCGRCDLPGGDAAMPYDSLQRLLTSFPCETRLFPGHDYADKPISTLGEQCQLNPFLHQDSAAAFVAFRAEHNKHRHPPYSPVPRGQPAW